MGLIDAKWPLSVRASWNLPPGISCRTSAKDRFDHIMAIYAAMIDRIDRSVGTLSRACRTRGVLDNTLILFLSDNGGNAEAGPDGRLERQAARRARIRTVFLGMNWATLANTPFRRYKHFTHEGGICHPADRPLAGGHSARASNGSSNTNPATSSTSWRPSSTSTGANVSAPSSTATTIQPMEGVSLLPAFAGKPLDRNAADLLGARRQPRHPRRQVEARVEAPRQRGSSTTWSRPHRAHDLAPRHPDVVKELAAAWEAWAKRANVNRWTGPPRANWGDEMAPAKK